MSARLTFFFDSVSQSIICAFRISSSRYGIHPMSSGKHNLIPCPIKVFLVMNFGFSNQFLFGDQSFLH
jgi:hypothetical protein